MTVRSKEDGKGIMRKKSKFGRRPSKEEVKDVENERRGKERDNGIEE